MAGTGGRSWITIKTASTMKYRRLLEDPIVRAELALRDLQSSLDHVRSAMEELASYISREKANALEDGRDVGWIKAVDDLPF